MKKIYLLLFLNLFSFKLIYSQISNVDFVVEGSNIIVTYDLSLNANIELLVALNGDGEFSGPLKEVSGDVGDIVMRGKNKQIKWNVLKEYPHGINSKNVQFLVRLFSLSGFTYIVNNIPYTMKYVKGGSFKMGYSKTYFEKCGKSSDIVVDVSLDDYYISEYEVTQELYESVMGENPSAFKGKKKPVERVSWDDCQLFIKKLNEYTANQRRNVIFSLPTEAQWEYAAKGGVYSNKDYIFSGSNITDGYVWCSTIQSYSGKTYDVGMVHSNELGIFDMSGNVSEWCYDWYGPYTESEHNPTGPINGKKRVIRGGSWLASPCQCSNVCRDKETPQTKSNTIGMRLVLTCVKNK